MDKIKLSIKLNNKIHNPNNYRAGKTLILNNEKWKVKKIKVWAKDSILNINNSKYNKPKKHIKTKKFNVLNEISGKKSINKLDTNNELKTISKTKNKKPLKGDKVKIIIKPYKNKIYKIGIVKRVLTKKKYHTRGHKVELNNGTIGRMICILKK